MATCAGTSKGFAYEGNPFGSNILRQDLCVRSEDEACQQCSADPGCKAWDMNTIMGSCQLSDGGGAGMSAKLRTDMAGKGAAVNSLMGTFKGGPVDPNSSQGEMLTMFEHVWSWALIAVVLAFIVLAVLPQNREKSSAAARTVGGYVKDGVKFSVEKARGGAGGGGGYDAVGENKG